MIEDEVPAQEVLRSFLSRVDWIELKAVFSDAISAMEYLKGEEVDVVFLDIQMPSMSGLDFIRITRRLPQVIITTAYSQHAVEAFDLDVKDYLLKPFSFERFLKALGRIDPQIAESRVQAVALEEAGVGYAFFNVNKTMMRVNFTDVLYVESMREYVYIHTSTGRIITKMTMHEMEQLLKAGFIRIHRSFLVNANKITAYNAEEVFVDKVSLPVGPSYKKFIEANLGRMSVKHV